jgi:nitrite reductase (NADH) small subunit
MEWFQIGSIDDIPALGARTVETSIGEVAVFRTGSGEVFALVNRCPHKGGPLSEGIVHGRKVACPLHNWVIDLNTGAADAPDEGCTTTIPVKRDGDDLYLGLDARKQAAFG